MSKEEFGKDVVWASRVLDTAQKEKLRHELAVKRNFMNTYRIEYKRSVVEDLGYSARVIVAHRVESWTNDYAFFGHPIKLGELTALIPRSLVGSVDLWTDSSGLGIAEGTDVPEPILHTEDEHFTGGSLI